MSRRITLLVLAASAALIATPASADPECFGDSCQLPEVVEPPAAAVQLRRGRCRAPEAAPSRPKRAPPRQSSPRPRRFLRWQPIRWCAACAADANLADDASVPPLAPRPSKRFHADRVPAAAAQRDAATAAAVRRRSARRMRRRRVMSARRGSRRRSRLCRGLSMRRRSAGIVVVVPGAVYGSGRYMFAPSAKIISIDSDD